MDVELLLAPQCPNAAAARSVLTACLRQLALDIPVRERTGDYPSPTILVDGVDVMTARRGAPWQQACRLDVPTAARVLAALHPERQRSGAAWSTSEECCGTVRTSAAAAVVSNASAVRVATPPGVARTDPSRIECRNGDHGDHGSTRAR